jgi:3-oxoacyl-[acyl-carrier protein] reductase
MGGPFDLRDRVAIVTGGANGIGREYVSGFLAAGACVLIADHDTAALSRCERDLTESERARVELAEIDVAIEEATLAMAEAAIERFGRIDVLVNNAGLMSTLPRGPWTEIGVVDWDAVMAVNLRGTFLCSRAVYPAMKAQHKGKIINISSSRVWEGTPNRLHYTTSKAGVIGFTRALAREVGPDGICVNAITPGLTLSDAQLAGSDSEYLAAAHSEGRALARAQLPGDLVGTVLFLASDASDFITGQTINVDGGRAMH